MKKSFFILAVLFFIATTPTFAKEDKNESNDDNHGTEVSIVAKTHPGGQVVSAVARRDDDEDDDQNERDDDRPRIHPSPRVSPSVSPTLTVSPTTTPTTITPTEIPTTSPTLTPSVSPTPVPDKDDHSQKTLIDELKKAIQNLIDSLNKLL